MHWTELRARARRAARPVGVLAIATLAGLACTGAGVAARTSPREVEAAPAIRFQDATKVSGLAHEATMTWGSLWADYDEDGDFDLFANRHWRNPRFYINEGAQYRLSDEEFFSGTRSVFDRHSCAWGEANGDGRVDLYCDSGAQKGEGFGANQLWLQAANGFLNVSKQYGTTDGFGRSRTVNWLDYDGDGDLDIFVGNKFRQRAPNTVFRNDRGRFTRVDVGLTERMNSLASSWSDWDRDGDPDLLVLRYEPGTAIAYENDDGSFTRTRLDGVSGRQWTSGAWGDFDGDGWNDLHLVSPGRSVVMRNLDGRFERVHSLALRAGASGAWLDVENDGDLDVFVVQGKSDGVNRPDFLLVRENGFQALRDPELRGPRTGSGESASVADGDLDGTADVFVTNGAVLSEESRLTGPWVLLENQTDAGNWVMLHTEGGDWNPWGFGARVHVEADGLAYWRTVGDGVAGRAQSQVGLLLLGIGDAQSARITVEWPEGGSDCLTAEAGTDVVASRRDATCDPT